MSKLEYEICNIHGKNTTKFNWIDHEEALRKTS